MTEEPAINKRRGEVPFPEAGEGAYLRFDVDALERLESKFGENYFDTIVNGMGKVRVNIFQAVMAACLTGSNSADIPYGLSFEELEERILDALYMTVHGRTFAEQREHQLEIMAERMGALSDQNPHLATLLSSKPATEQDTGQG